jgi:hypothetical protein
MSLEQIYLIPGANTAFSAPANTVAPLVTGIADEDEVLSCTEGTWVGTGTISYTYQWQRGSSAISGATSSTYTVTLADRGFLISCVVTATDDLGDRSVSSNFVGPVPAIFYLELEEGGFLLLEDAGRIVFDFGSIPVNSIQSLWIGAVE